MQHRTVCFSHAQHSPPRVSCSLWLGVSPWGSGQVGSAPGEATLNWKAGSNGFILQKHSRFLSSRSYTGTQPGLASELWGQTDCWVQVPAPQLLRGGTFSQVLDLWDSGFWALHENNSSTSPQATGGFNEISPRKLLEQSLRKGKVTVPIVHLQARLEAMSPGL